MRDREVRVIEADEAERFRNLPGPPPHPVLGRDLTFDGGSLARHLHASLEPMMFDAFVVLAAVEYADKSFKRFKRVWGRNFWVTVPVHDPDHWNSDPVRISLIRMLNMLTGDRWSFQFVLRKQDADVSDDPYFCIDPLVDQVIPFSDGMDSLAVAGIITNQIRHRLLPIRVGGHLGYPRSAHAQQICRIPYQVRAAKPQHTESSFRSRGLKFLLVASMAAVLAKARTVLVPENVIAAAGHRMVLGGNSYPDYHVHPQFTTMLEEFISQVFGHSITIKFPTFWQTKGQTLREYLKHVPNGDWRSTRSCWMGSRMVSINGVRRQCGICAACLLRRVATWEACPGQEDDVGTYVFPHLQSHSFEDSIHPHYTQDGQKFLTYAIAGTAYVENLAQLGEQGDESSIQIHSTSLGYMMDLDPDECSELLRSVLAQHAREWRNFLRANGRNSFPAEWSRRR